MKSFFKVKNVAEVLALIAGFSPLEAETIPLRAAHGRIPVTSITAREDVPDFNRSTMDGYAVRARETFGATENMPALFEVAGEVLMGRKPGFETGPGQAARIWTGGMMPPGADAVVMIEYARKVDEHFVELARPVAPFENVIRTGEDVKTGDVLAIGGRRLRPQDLGLLAALGIQTVDAVRIPRVAVISTGDEIVPVSDVPGPGQVRDVNTYTISAMVEAAGGIPVVLPLVKDNKAHLREAVAKGMAEADVVVLSGGSSVGVRDFTVEVFESFEGSEILVHGVSVSPGKPTIMARCGNKSLWGLPGHTVSAMITFDLFVRPLLSRLSAETMSPFTNRAVKAKLSRSVPSVHGREDYVRVRLENPNGGCTAHPILGKSGIISTMVKADGLIKIGLNDEGLEKGTIVDVVLFQ